MDEMFLGFLAEFGQATSRQEVPQSSIQRYSGILPDRLLDYWQEHGWSGYGDGLFWTVNPQEYEPILEPWLSASGLKMDEKHFVIARSAFGELYVWGARSGLLLTVSSYLGRYSHLNLEQTIDLNTQIGAFFYMRNLTDDRLDGLFDEALARLGSLKPDEVYGFVPALALGGSLTVDNLQKVKIIEYLEFLSQLSPLQDWHFPDIRI